MVKTISFLSPPAKLCTDVFCFLLTHSTPCPCSHPTSLRQEKSLSRAHAVMSLLQGGALGCSPGKLAATRAFRIFPTTLRPDGRSPPIWTVTTYPQKRAGMRRHSNFVRVSALRVPNLRSLPAVRNPRFRANGEPPARKAPFLILKGDFA